MYIQTAGDMRGEGGHEGRGGEGGGGHEEERGEGDMLQHNTNQPVSPMISIFFPFLNSRLNPICVHEDKQCHVARTVKHEMSLTFNKRTDLPRQAN